MRLHCAEIGADDGTDPRYEVREDLGTKRRDRKTLQLCRQVAETLDQVLSGEIGNPLIAGLQVVAVTPAPDAAQLLVLVQQSPGEQIAAPEKILEQLSAAGGVLRSAMAAAITRRRAPRLLFQVIAAPALPEEDNGEEAQT